MRLRPIRLFLALLAFATIPAPIVAQETRNIQAQFGRQSYRLFCAGCHGPTGEGGGPVADALDIPMSDLRDLAARNGGSFPAEEIRGAISGPGLRAHLDLRIAPWAEVFADEFESFAAKAAANAMVARRIDHIIAYIESIQR